MKESQQNQSKNDEKGGVFPFWKNAGETLAVMLRRFRAEQGLTIEDKLTYAGRLDPMAEGIVPILVGEARFQKEHIMSKRKTYEVGVLFGLATDSGDMLGLTTSDPVLRPISLDPSSDSTESAIKKALHAVQKITELPYPQYSSRPVDGKPLFVHARAGKSVQLPMKKVTIYSMELLNIQTLPLADAVDAAIETIEKVQGDFRQEEIVRQWNTIKSADGDKLMTIATTRTTVSSGTYMRSLSEKIGELLGVPALAYHIKRTEIE